MIRSVHQIDLKVADLDLSALPVQTHWPGDAGPLITWPAVVNRSFGSAAGDIGAYNAGVHRAQVLGRDVILFENTPMDYPDFTSPQPGPAGKMGIDATPRIYSETNREWESSWKRQPRTLHLPPIWCDG